MFDSRDNRTTAVSCCTLPGLLIIQLPSLSQMLLLLVLIVSQAVLVLLKLTAVVDNDHQCSRRGMSVRTRVTRRMEEVPAADKIETSEFFEQVC